MTCRESAETKTRHPSHQWSQTGEMMAANQELTDRTPVCFSTVSACFGQMD